MGTPSDPPAEVEESRAEEQPSEPLTLGKVVRSGRRLVEYLSPSNKDSAPAAVATAAADVDASISRGIHAGYQAVKGVANDTPPVIVLGVVGLAVGIPSARFGMYVFSRNTGLALALTAALIYPDKIASQGKFLKKVE